MPEAANLQEPVMQLGFLYHITGFSSAEYIKVLDARTGGEVLDAIAFDSEGNVTNAETHEVIPWAMTIVISVEGVRALIHFLQETLKDPPPNLPFTMPGSN